MDYNLMKNNKVFIAGEVVSEPKFSHEVFGENFYDSWMYKFKRNLSST